MRLFGLEIRSASEAVSDADATEVVIDRQYQRAKGEDVFATELMVAEIAAATWARTFAAAAVSGEAARLVTPRTMSMIGRALALHGEIAFVIRGMQLIPAHSITVQGDADPATWTYRLTLPGPTDSQTAIYPASQILHFRIGTDPQRPWRGQSPLVAARAGAGTLTALERSYREGLNVQRLAVLTTEDRVRPAQATEVISTLSVSTNARRQVAFLGTGARTQLHTITPDVSEGHNTMRAQLAGEVLAAYGLSPVMLNPQAPATSLREVARALLNSTIKPVSMMIAEEVMAKTGTALEFDFAALQTSDVAGQARAVAALVKAGVSVNEALAQTGLADTA